MTFVLTASDWRALFPKAPEPVIVAFAQDPASLARAGITETRTRLAYALANVEHECGGFAIPGLIENIRYTAERMATVWPNRFQSADDVRNRFGTKPGWQKKAFDEIYGNRMGNRPGTSDGSTYIGRGGPQVTGRDGYKEVGKRCGLDLVNNPDMACEAQVQPALLSAFWSWKNLNKYADAGDFIGCVKAWNGGTNGLADRKAHLAANDPIIGRLKSVAALLPKLENIA